MLSDKVLTTVRTSFDSFYQVRSEELRREIRRAENQLALNGLGNSTAVPDRFRELCEAALRDCQSKILELFERALRAFETQLDAELTKPITREIHTTLQPIVCEYNRKLSDASAKAGVKASRNLDDESDRLGKESAVEVELLIARLKSEAEIRRESHAIIHRQSQPSTNATRVDQYLQGLKNHRSIAILVLAGVIIAGLSTLTDSVDKIWSFLEKRIFHSANLPSERSQAQTITKRQPPLWTAFTKVDASKSIPPNASIAKIQFRLWSEDNSIPLIIRVASEKDGKIMNEVAGPSGVVEQLITEKQTFYISFSHPGIRYEIGILGFTVN
jgi:hypothetical protein